jgi:hypothetical protein
MMTNTEWVEQTAWDVNYVLGMYRGKPIQEKEYRLDIKHLLPTKVHRALAQECLDDPKLIPLSVLRLWVELYPSIVPTFEEFEDDEL